MDKLKIIYHDSLNKNYSYEFRIPENINWFVITRFSNNENDNFDSDQLIYNGNKLILQGYSYMNLIKKNKYYSNELATQKVFAYNILKSIGINSFTLKILDILEFETKKLKLKYWKSYFFNNNEKYELQENLQNNERYFNILSNKSNNILGKLYINEGNVEIEIYYNNQIDIERLYNTMQKKLKNNKQKVLSW